MTNNPAPHRDLKLTITMRLEPGCLGPDGDEHIDGFCRVVQERLGTVDATFVHWSFIPRHDKSLPEVQYDIAGKRLSESMAQRYLERFGRQFDEFEEQLHDRIAGLIEQYLGRE